MTYGNGFRERAQPVTRYGYDLLGRLVSKLDGNGQRETQQVLAGTTAQAVKVAASWDGGGGMQRLDYNAFGESVLRRVLVNVGSDTFNHTGYEYDGAGRLIAQHQQGYGGQGVVGLLDGGASQSLGTLTARYRYDGRGLRISQQNAVGDVSKTYYDSLGRVTQTVSAEGATTRYQYQYVAIGSADGIQGAGGRDLGGYRKTTVDAVGRASQEWVDYFERSVRREDLGHHRFDYRYDWAGRLVSQQGSGQSQGGQYQRLEYDYYANGYLKAAYDLNNQTASRYRYDNAGLRVGEAYMGFDPARREAGGSPVYQDATLVYDELGRLARAIDASAFTTDYEYDAVGNRQTGHRPARHEPERHALPHRRRRHHPRRAAGL